MREPTEEAIAEHPVEPPLARSGDRRAHQIVQKSAPVPTAHLKKESVGYDLNGRGQASAHHSSKSLRRFYRGFYNALKKEKAPSRRPYFNPEEPANRKREWLELRAQRNKSPGWPEHNFEHLVIVGIPPTADISSMSREISQEAVKRKQGGVSTGLPNRQSEKPNHNPPKPSYVPELLYQFPEDKPLHMSPDELVSFCFPDGVTPRLLSRSSSMSALNEIVYGQQHMVQSDQSFVFLQKGGDDLPMFGICYYVNQMVHTPPGLARQSFSERKLPLTRYLVAAPRCYCILSRYPFFDLHFQVLNLILGLERLDIIRDYVDEVSALPPRQRKANNVCPYDRQSTTPASSIFPASTPEPQYLNPGVSVSPSPPSSARKSESGVLRPFVASPGVALRRRSFSMDPLLRPREQSRGRLSQIQDSFSSIPGLQKVRKHDVAASSCPRDPGGKSAGLKEKSEKLSGQSGSCPLMDNRAGPGADALESKPLNKDTQSMATPFLLHDPSISNDDLQGSCKISDFSDGRAMDVREITLDPGSCLRDEQGDSLGQGRDCHGDNHWLHARSISGQSLRDYDPFDEPAKAAAHADMPVIAVPTHCRGDSAFYGLEFHSMPLLRGRSSTPPVALGGHCGESEACTNQSHSSPRSPWWPVRRSNSQDAMSVGGASLASIYFRSPSCHEIYSRGMTPPLLWRGETDGRGSRLTAAQSVLYSFHSMPVPVPGERIVFAPEEGLQTIEYCRPLLKANEYDASGSQRIDQRHLGIEVAQIEAEAACELRIWTVASLCRSLSLENILSLLVAAMFEKQIVFFCSNIGVLSSAVLSLIPLLRPFTWQSLLMPVVPTRLLDLLDAPVPFAVGLQHKTQEVAHRCGDLVRVNLYKDSIKNAPAASNLPGYRQLFAKLATAHKLLHQKGLHTKRPMHIPTSTETSAVESFLTVFTDYLQKLVGDLRRHTITEVGKDGQRVCLLLEESLVESFPQKDWPFMKAFVQTQMFSSFSDAVISSFE